MSRHVRKAWVHRAFDGRSGRSTVAQPLGFRPNRADVSVAAQVVFSVQSTSARSRQKGRGFSMEDSMAFRQSRILLALLSGAALVAAAGAPSRAADELR